MKLKRGFCAQIAGLGLLMCSSGYGAEGDGSIDLTLTNGTKRLQLPVVSGVDAFHVLRTTDLSAPFSLAPTGSISGYNWTQPLQAPSSLEFFRVEMQPKDPGSILNGSLLYRLGYGPTPDELDRLNQIGSAAYIQEQLAPETIQENLEIDRVVPATGDWQYVTATGTASSTALYLYLTQAGEVYIDDIKLVRGTVAEVGTSAISNGDFETGLTGWIVDPIYTNSFVTTV